MKSTKTDYKTISKKGESYFYGANGKDGFTLTPDGGGGERFCDYKIYIKGGPGTGKSSYIEKFAAAAEDAGYKAVYYYCSSDPDSLDAAVVTKNGRTLVICDATSPHAADPVYPGAKSEYFDLSRFWDRGSLINSAEYITRFTDKKRKCFDAAYGYIHAAAECGMLGTATSRGICCTDKLEAFSERFTSGFKGCSEYTERYVSALSMKGAVMLDTYVKRADEVFYIDDSLGLSTLVVKSLADHFASSGVGVDVALCPVDPDKIEAIYVRREKVFITVVDPGNFAKRINSARFLARDAGEHRTRYRFLAKCESEFLDGALKSLANAAGYHFELEKIFSRAMDFESADKYFESNILNII